MASAVYYLPDGSVERNVEVMLANIRWLAKKSLAPGTIVILHDGIRDATRSIGPLPDILAEGKRRGLRFVSIGDLTLVVTTFATLLGDQSGSAIAIRDWERTEKRTGLKTPREGQWS
jgi:hypothetical protein